MRKQGKAPEGQLSLFDEPAPIAKVQPQADSGPMTKARCILGLMLQIRRDMETLTFPDDYFLTGEREFYEGRLANYRAYVLEIENETEVSFAERMSK